MFAGCSRSYDDSDIILEIRREGKLRISREYNSNKKIYINIYIYILETKTFMIRSYISD